MDFLQKNRTLVQIVCGLIILACVVNFFRGCSKPASRVALDQFSALGQITAEEIAKLVGSKKEIVLVVEGLNEQTDTTARAMLGAFQSAAQKAGLTVAATEKVPHLSSSQFFGSLTNHPTAGGMVYFATTLPPLEQELDKFPESGPKIVVVGLGPMGGALRQPLETGKIQMAVLSRFVASGTRPATAREWFDRNYQIVTPANVGTVFPAPPR